MVFTLFKFRCSMFFGVWKIDTASNAGPLIVHELRARENWHTKIWYCSMLQPVCVNSWNWCKFDYSRWQDKFSILCMKFAYEMYVQNWWMKFEVWYLKCDSRTQKWPRNRVLTRTTRRWMMIEKSAIRWMNKYDVW